MTRIVGIFLLKNEDRFVAQAVRNVTRFCDQIIIADNGSTDGTWNLLQDLGEKYSHIELHRIKRPSESHDLISSLAGTETWVFGVDGDEIYDPEGLDRFRPTLLSGSYDDAWAIFGNVLNVTWLSDDGSHAKGYLAAPSRSITKLYNFAAIESWDGPCPERLHGGNPIFRDGYSASKRLDLHSMNSWEQADLRCLHLCFIPRSSRDTRTATRRNPAELMARGLRGRVMDVFRSLQRREPISDWKREKYMRGELVNKDTVSFFSK